MSYIVSLKILTKPIFLNDLFSTCKRFCAIASIFALEHYADMNRLSPKKADTIETVTLLEFEYASYNLAKPKST